ncbi:MAG: hypothetical protein RBT71_11530, partial [Flavobacteriales bacterium]|nr:hypothetical protein [Flavobacteriales bacterium]
MPTAAPTPLRRLLRWTGRTVLVLLLLTAIIAGLLTVPAVQTRVAGRLAAWATEELGAEVRIGAIAFRPFSELELRGVYIGDLHGDTLIAVDLLRVDGLQLSTGRRHVQARTLHLRNARFALGIAPGDTTSNLTQLVDKLAGADTTAGADWTVRCGVVDIGALHFTFHRADSLPIPFGVDFAHVDVRGDRIRGHQFRAAGDSIGIHLEELALSEHSGFRLDQLLGAAQVSPRGITIDHMRLRTPHSAISGRLRFTTPDWAAYSDFTSAVNMRLALDSSLVDFRDIAFFAPGLEGIELPIHISGRVRGPVSEMKGRDLDIRFGERSHFRGHAELTGLPDFANTFMLVDVDELRTMYTDLAA